MWGVPSPVVVHRRFVAKVGVKCSAGCPLAGHTIVVRNGAGADVGHGRLGEAPEPGTRALYAAGITLDAPAEEGVHAWTAAFDGAPAPAAAAEATPTHEAAPAREADPVRDPPRAHEGATATFGFRTVAPPQHRVTVTVCDRDREAPLADAEVRVGVYRGTTDANGQTQVEVRAGSYDLYVRKAGYAPHTDSVEVSGDVTFRVAAAPISDTDPDDEQVWM